jgi:uncharacterized LabA/DUF88 family protein
MPFTAGPTLAREAAHEKRRGTMQRDDKEAVRRAMRAAASRAVGATTTYIASDHQAAELDPATEYSIDDLSQSDDEGEFVGLGERVESGEIDLLAAIDALDLAPKDAVGPGAIVSFDGDRYVVGVAMSEFTSDDVAYTGLAADAPLYPSIVGLRAGDRFTFRGVDHVVDDVW